MLDERNGLSWNGDNSGELDFSSRWSIWGTGKSWRSLSVLIYPTQSSPIVGEGRTIFGRGRHSADDIGGATVDGVACGVEGFE